jgi:hypothetical protein
MGWAGSTLPLLVRILGGAIGLVWFPVSLLTLPYALTHAWRRAVWRAVGAFVLWGIWLLVVIGLPVIGTGIPGSAAGIALVYGFFAWWVLSALAIGCMPSTRPRSFDAPDEP